MRSIHALAGAVAFLTILTFWTATVAVEALGTGADIALVKTGVLWGLGLLIPALALTGASGLELARRRVHPLVRVKQRRMQLAAANGILILVPAAVFLAWRASAGAFDGWFYAVQTVELVAGATNLVLLALNARDGRRMTRGRASAPRSGRAEAGASTTF